ncbi:hypothetical protein NQZ68_020133 [Dissostichus eleginoides]|nr:hypothetical protein NQZ68_020133 [Dissostichus eleginoides]
MYLQTAITTVEYGCAEEDFTPETSRRDGVALRFGLGPASTGRVLLCGGGFTTAGACFPPVLVLLLPPVVCCGVVCCFAEETFYPGDTTERPERFHAAAFACPLLLC